MIPDGKTEINEIIKRLWHFFFVLLTKWNKKDTAQKWNECWLTEKKICQQCIH
jgi:hypothetical protein